MGDHVLFPIIVASIFALQILLVTFAGNAFGVYSNYGLTVQQWLISVKLLRYRLALARSLSWFQ